MHGDNTGDDAGEGPQRALALKGSASNWVKLEFRLNDLKATGRRCSSLSLTHR
jgi:hypothetical protein